MSATPDSASPASRAGVFATLLDQIKRHPVLFAVNLVICGAAAFLINVYVAVVMADGIVKIQGYPFVWPGEPWWRTGQIPYQPLLFWLLGGFMFSSFLAYWQAAGTKSVIDGLIDGPARVRDRFQTATSRQLALFALGAAAGLLLFGRFSAWFQILMGVFGIFVALTFARRGAGLALWLLGIAGACLAAYPFGGLSFAFRMAFLLALACWWSSAGDGASRAQVRTLVLLALCLIALVAPETLLAHDGGLNEGGNTIDGVINSGGFASVIHSGSWAGAMGLIGGAAGSPLGSALGGGGNMVA